MSLRCTLLRSVTHHVAGSLYQEKPKLPFIPGGEVSGTVLEVGAAVRGLSVGQPVLAVLPRFGAFAEQVIARGADVFPLPPGVDLVPAAGLAVAYGTAHVALEHRCRVMPGQNVLVLGAAGGVGLAAVQLVKALGARVAAVARGEAKCAALHAEGADCVLDSATLKGSLKEALASFAPKGVHVIFDPVGGKALMDAMKCLAWGGQVAVIGFASGDIPKLPANLLLVKSITVHGIYWGSYAAHEPAVLRDSLRRLAEWLAAGKLHVRVSHALPLQCAHKAFAALLKREAVGKVVLVMGGEQAKL